MSDDCCVLSRVPAARRAGLGNKESGIVVSGAPASHVLNPTKFRACVRKKRGDNPT